MMRRETKVHAIGIGWLAGIALFTGLAAATEPASFNPDRISADGYFRIGCIGEAAKSANRGMTPGRAEILSPRLSELEQRLFDHIHDGTFGEFSLLEAGLIAGGVDRLDELSRYSKRFDELVESLRRSGKVCGTPRERAQAVFTFLHQSVLCGGYRLQSSDLRMAIDRGRFNCVTASLLFNCLAQRFELKAAGLEIPGHAMSRLELPQEILDIETTCPRWFTLNDRPGMTYFRRADEPAQAQQETTARADLAVRSPARDAADKTPPLRPVSEVELVATIYYNRGVELLAKKLFADAAAANAKAVRLDPKNATAKGNYLATINNWAVDLAISGNYERAAALLRLGLVTDPSYEAFRSNYVQLFRRWSEHLCRNGRYDDAVRLLGQAAKDQPGEEFFHEAAIEILRRWAGKEDKAPL